MKLREQLSGLRSLTEKQLSAKIAMSQKDLVVKQQEKLLGKLKNTASLKAIKKEIARMKTVLDEKILQRLNEGNNEQS